jgi:hypothetical protein
MGDAVSRSKPLARPPVLACWILESVVPSPSPNAVVGDLMEEYVDRAAVDSLAAARWFWSQTVRSVPLLLVSAARTEWRVNVRVALIIYLLTETLKVGITDVLSLWVTRPLTWILVAPVTFVVLNAAGGLMIAHIRRAAAVTLSAMVMLTVAVLSLWGLCRISVPWWYQLAFFAAAPLSILIPPAIRGSAISMPS